MSQDTTTTTAASTSASPVTRLLEPLPGPEAGRAGSRSCPIPFSATEPRPHPSVARAIRALPPQTDFSEAGMWARSAELRLLETRPPIVPRFVVGTWAVGYGGGLWQLREFLLDDDSIRWNETAPWASDRELMWSGKFHNVEKYLLWMAEGHMPPPLGGTEVRLDWGDPSKHGLRVVIYNGHHRAVALYRSGYLAFQCWVDTIDTMKALVPTPAQVEA